jgi:hypothetical protein
MGKAEGKEGSKRKQVRKSKKNSIDIKKQRETKPQKQKKTNWQISKTKG